MIRAIRKFVSSLTGARRYVFFMVLLVICVVSLCLGIYIQFFYKYAETDPLMLGINKGMKKTAEEISVLKSNFNNLFNNEVITNNEEIRVEKRELSNDIVYEIYNFQTTDDNYYNVNAQIPFININSETADEINAEISKEFRDTATNIMRRREGNTIYNVSYVAFVNNDILSLVIKSSLKEEGKAEKVVVKTYNYSISNLRRVTFEEVLKAKDVTSSEIQSTINQEIKTAYTNAKIIAAEYGVLYERDLNSPMYKVENTENFFLTQDGYVYIIYAYGNNDYTNEMDIIIF